MSAAPSDLKHVERDRLGHHASKLREQDRIARRRSQWNWYSQRTSDLTRIIAHRIAPARMIPQTDDANVLILAMARHLRAKCGDDRLDEEVDAWCRQMAPWVASGAAEVLADILRDVAPHDRDFTALALGNMLRVTWNERCALGLRTIRPYGLTWAEFDELRQQRKRTVDRQTAWIRRRDAGKVTWDERCWQHRDQPWKLIGFGRRSWEIAKAKGALSALVARAKLPSDEVVPAWVIEFARQWDGQSRFCALASRLPEGSVACDASAQSSPPSASERDGGQVKSRTSGSLLKSQGTRTTSLSSVAAPHQEDAAPDNARGTLRNSEEIAQHEEEPDAHRDAA